MKAAKILAVVVAVIVVALAGVVGAGWFWLRAHRDELNQVGRDSFREGAHFGSGKDASACVAEAERRLPAKSASFDDIVRESANKNFLDACLKASTTPPGFCDGVPPIGDMTASVQWLNDRCASVAQRAPCTRLLGVVQERCASLSSTTK